MTDDWRRRNDDRCKYGHPLYGDNLRVKRLKTVRKTGQAAGTVYYRKVMYCGACHAEWMRLYRERKLHGDHPVQ